MMVEKASAEGACAGCPDCTDRVERVRLALTALVGDLDSATIERAEVRAHAH